MPLKVMVVEDDLATLELMFDVLSSFGVEVRPVSDSEQAAALINQEKFDSIFLDLIMPRINGFELARKIRQSSWNCRTPIVVVTGREAQETMAEAFGAGATFFLQKPVDRAKLLKLLNSTRGTMLEERRRFKRISIRTDVACRVDSREFTGPSSNLSQEGILFQGDGSLRPGNLVRLSFCLPGQKLPIETKGVVVRIDEKQRAGVRHTEISPEDRSRIGDLIASQSDSS